MSDYRDYPRPYAEPLTDEDVHICGYSRIEADGLLIDPATRKEGQLPEPPCTQAEAEYALDKVGWDGKGKLQLLWLPPCIFHYDLYGILLWYVFDEDAGHSWLVAKSVVPIVWPCIRYWKGVNLVAFREATDG